MNRHFALTLAYVVILWPSLSRAAPNVLFIAVDDLRPELGCYGASYAQTPNLDELAQSAVLFTNHFVQVPT